MADGTADGDGNGTAIDLNEEFEVEGSELGKQEAAAGGFGGAGGSGIGGSLNAAGGFVEELEGGGGDEGDVAVGGGLSAKEEEAEVAGVRREVEPKGGRLAGGRGNALAVLFHGGELETDAGGALGKDLVGGGFEAFEVVTGTDVDGAGAVGDGGIDDQGPGARAEEGADEFEDEAGFDIEGAGVVIDAIAGEVEGAGGEGEGGGEGIEDAGGAAGDEAGAGFEGKDGGVEVLEGLVREG